MGVKYKFYVTSTAPLGEPDSRDQFLKAIFGDWGKKEWEKLNTAIHAQMHLSGVEWVAPVIQPADDCSVCFVVFPTGQVDYLMGDDRKQFDAIVADWAHTVTEDAHAQGWDDIDVSLLTSEAAERPPAVGVVTDTMERAGEKMKEEARSIASGFSAFLRDLLMGSKLTLVVGSVIVAWWILEQVDRAKAR